MRVGLTIDRRVFVEQAALVELLGRLVFAPDDAARRTAEDVGRVAKEFLKQNKDVATEIDRRIRAKMNDVALPVEGIEEAE